MPAWLKVCGFACYMQHSPSRLHVHLSFFLRYWIPKIRRVAVLKIIFSSLKFTSLSKVFPLMVQITYSNLVLTIYWKSHGNFSSSPNLALCCVTGYAISCLVLSIYFSTNEWLVNLLSVIVKFTIILPTLVGYEMLHNQAMMAIIKKVFP